MKNGKDNFLQRADKMFSKNIVRKAAMLRKANLYVTKFNFALIGKMQLTEEEERNLKAEMKKCAADLLKAAE